MFREVKRYKVLDPEAPFVGTIVGHWHKNDAWHSAPCFFEKDNLYFIKCSSKAFFHIASDIASDTLSDLGSLSIGC